MIARKCFGQNFLQNPAILSQMVDSLQLQPGDIVLEVGPGPAYLTKMIIPKVSAYFAVEIDHQFSPILEALKKEHQNFHYVLDDFLKVPLQTFRSCNKFVGNLPYNISTPILYRLATETNIEKLVCMFAQGTADRFLAGAGSANYSAGSILAQSFFEVEKIMVVPRSQFSPVPKIDSIVLRFTRKEGNLKHTIAFNDWVQPLFSYRRKTILNSLIQSSCSKDFANQILFDTGVKPGERVENLSLDKLIQMYKVYTCKEKI